MQHLLILIIYRFITEPATNGPGTASTYTQYYSWFIGLGSDYNFYTYEAQCAVPRKLLPPFYLLDI